MLLFFQPVARRFIDLEEAVLRWSKANFYLNGRSSKERKLQKKHYDLKKPSLDVVIDWSKLNISHKTKWANMTVVDFKFDAAPEEEDSTKPHDPSKEDHSTHGKYF